MLDLGTEPKTLLSTPLPTPGEEMQRISFTKKPGGEIGSSDVNKNKSYEKLQAVGS